MNNFYINLMNQDVKMNKMNHQIDKIMIVVLIKYTRLKIENKIKIKSKFKIDFLVIYNLIQKIKLNNKKIKRMMIKIQKFKTKKCNCNQPQDSHRKYQKQVHFYQKYKLLKSHLVCSQI